MTKLTIQCRLVAEEETRRWVWEMMAGRYAPLIATTLGQVSQHKDFPQWVATGELPAQVVKNLVNQAKSGLPARWCASAQRQVQETYKAWLKRRRKLQQKLQAQQTWLSVLRPDAELAQDAGLSLEEMKIRAQALLHREINNWFQAYQQCQDVVERSIFAYLLKHRLTVPTEPEDTDKLRRKRRQVEIKIERLETQLAGRSPQGRDLTGNRYATALHEGEQCYWEDDADFLAWQAEILSRPDSLPPPVEYATNTDMTWHKDEQGRLAVTFNGLGKLKFKIACDQRQLHWFQRFYQDQEQFKAQKGQRSQALFTLRSVELLWKPGNCSGEPWQANFLYLHCTVDSRLWTQEGTAMVQQEKAKKSQRIVEKLSERSDLTAQQKECLQRHQSTLVRLQMGYDRPQRRMYQGKSHLAVGISLDMENLVTVALVDVVKQKVITGCTMKSLLGQDYALVQRLRYEKRQNSHLRKVAQERGSKIVNYEANLGIHVERLLVKAIIHFAQQHLAGSLCVPTLKDIRETIQSHLQCRAEERHPNSKELQHRYAKEYRINAHRWSYNRLLKLLNQQAKIAGLVVEQGVQSAGETALERALGVALSAYYQRSAA
ncbi:type V CRISPR-associated protein Cas12k [Gloeomargaritales cyanobacterium VI4D9]|nr:type V CRISPR-associated protein Cas12k [Gloeomargaritales cyanobacterium VI4D9]